MEYQVKGGSVSCQIQKAGVCIISSKAEEAYFEIPPVLEGYPVTGIGKKAFLGNKILKELMLPDTVEEIGEWAFAHCSQMEKIWIAKKDIRFGKGAFKDCNKLKAILLHGEDNMQVAGLLGAVPVMLDAQYLLTPLEAGEESWLYKLDARLVTLLEKPDREGYSRQVLCGEEDLMASLDVYLTERRRHKARLCYLRLLHDMGLEEDVRICLNQWLREHTKGCESEASWEVLLEENTPGQDLEQIFADAGCITEENFDGLLADMKDQYPEKKAWLLRYKDTHMQKDDFFENMIL